ncbi:hypothetical protein SDC9_98429 [bioreactor metagenome]|uniref:Uncharacterized protein n=1 Tax=bioreactor metagenome TaxID=1076179 RepID=A0A645AG45_9ZZZZ
MGRSVVHHREARSADLPRDGGGEEGFPQARLAVQQKVPSMLFKRVGIVCADLIHRFHVLPGGDAVNRVRGLVVPIHGKGIEALPRQVQRAGQLGLLLLRIISLQADTRRLAFCPRVAAQRAGGLVFEIIRRKPQIRQKLGPLLLKAEIAVPQHRHRRAGVRPLAQGGDNDAAHGRSQLRVDLPQPGRTGIRLLLPPAEGLLPTAAVRVEPGGGPAHNFSVVGHSAPPLLLAPVQRLHIPAHLLLRRALVPPGRLGLLRLGTVPRSHLLRRMKPRLVPALQNSVYVGPL